MEEVHGTGPVLGERLPAASTPVEAEETIQTTNASHPSSIPISASGPISAPTQVLEPTPPPMPTQQPPATASPLPDVTIPGNEPPAYSPTPLPLPPPTPGSPSPPLPSPPSPSLSSTRSPSPPPPPLPPSPAISPVRTLPATRPASFPLLPTNLNIPSCTPRPYTFHQHPPPALLPAHHSIAIDIFPDPDVSPPHAEQLPTYSRYPKHGEAHCMGEIGDPDARSEISRLTWDGRSRRQGDGICCCGLYMRTVVTGIVVLIIACVVAGGVVGWQMKANFENVPDSGPQSTPLNGGPGGGGNVDNWSPPGDVGNSQPSSTISVITRNGVLEPTPTATVLIQTMRLVEPTPTSG